MQFKQITITNLVINDCGDVDTTSKLPIINDVLLYDGVNWVPDSSTKSNITQNTTDIATNTSNISTNATNIATNTADILTNTLAISDLLSKQGAQLIYTIANIAVGRGASNPGEVFVNDPDPANINQISCYLVDNDGNTITQPQPGDTLLFTNSDQSNEFRFLISAATDSTALDVTLVYSTPGIIFSVGNVFFTYLFPTNDTFATKEYVDNLQVSTDASITANTDALTNFVIDNCGDVDTTTNPPVANNTLVWDDVNSKWIPGTTSDAQVAQNTADISLNTTNIAQNTTDIASNTTALSNFVINDCLDVNTTSIAPSVDDTLTWSGLNWVPDGTINADISQNAANIATNTADIAANKLQIDSHEISINDLRANQGAQLVYVVTNVTIGTGATLAGELFVNDLIPSNVNTVSLALTDKNGTAITQPQAGDTLLFTSADQSEEFRYIIDSASKWTKQYDCYICI